MRQHSLHHEKVSEQVGAECALEFSGIDLERIFGLMLLRRVVDKDIEPTELFDGSLDRLRAELFLADIASDLDGARAFALDQTKRLVRVLILLQIDDGDLRSLAPWQRRWRGRCRCRRR